MTPNSTQPLTLNVAEHLHTEQATRFPALLHLCELADEYI
jgi:hypothetical protein